MLLPKLPAPGYTDPVKFFVLYTRRCEEPLRALAAALEGCIGRLQVAVKDVQPTLV